MLKTRNLVYNGITVADSRALLNFTRKILLFGCAFFASWVDGLQNIFGFDVAKLFPLFAFALILYWITLEKASRSPFPRAFNIFMTFVIVQTVITYGVFHRDEFTFYQEIVGITQDGFAITRSGNGLEVARFFLFAGFGYAAAALLRNRRELIAFSLWYATGLMVSFLLGSHAESTLSFERLTGGYMNPNNLGRAAMVSIFLCLMTIRFVEVRPWQRGIAIFLLAGSFYALLSSVSRTPLIAMAVGILVMISLEPLRKKVRFTAAIAAVALSTLMLLPGATANSLRERFDPNYMQAQGYGHRIFITQDYLEQWPSYIVNGMGYSRAVEAVRNSYNRMARLYVPHSAYLSVFVEFGAPGLFLFLWSIYHIWQFVNPSRNGRQRLPADSLIAGFLAAWIVYFLTGNFGERIFWLSWAVIAAYGHLRPPSFDNPLVTTGSHQKAAAGGVR